MGPADTKPDQISAWWVRLGLNHQFSSAQTSITTRQVIIVRIDENGHTGWGEAAPVPGHTPEDIETLWRTLQQLTRDHGLEAAQRSNGMIRAAFNQAADDAAARSAGLPLWKMLGGREPTPASAAIGLDSQGHPDRTQVESAAAAGYRHIKLKITPATDPTGVAALARHHPTISFSVDANGSFRSDETGLLSALDAIGLEYFEQPGDPNDLEMHARLRRQLTTPISLDESAHSSDAIARIVTAGAADIVNLKVGRFGTSRALGLATELATAGVRARIGGLVETGIGRAHSVALAAHPIFTVVGDIAGSDRYFADDLVVPQWRVKDGHLSLPTDPGIGVDVNAGAVADLAADSITVS